MPRGKMSPVGATRVADNGYQYIRTSKAWRLHHHVIAEEKIGRPLQANERVEFIDRDRKNLDPENITVVIKSQNAKLAELERLEERKADLEEKILELKRELEIP